MAAIPLLLELGEKKGTGGQIIGVPRAMSRAESTIGMEHGGEMVPLPNRDASSAVEQVYNGFADTSIITVPSIAQLAEKQFCLPMTRRQGKYEEAGRLYQRAITITEKTQGRDHFDVALLLKGHADVLKKQVSKVIGRRLIAEVC